MTDSEALKKYTCNLTAMYVEDDPVGAIFIRKMLEPLFREVYKAVDGSEGLQMFNLHHPDVIVTDLMMPVLDGIEMLREIRKSNQKVPVVLMTASLEHMHLVEAINLGVSKFLAKPLRVDAVHQALLGVTRELHMELVTQQSRKQELELLRYRNRYHSRQEELAQAKERHISKSQLDMTFVSGQNECVWMVDQIQLPKDIMSGDSFSILYRSNGTLLLFMADAMGHGLSASVTSMLGTAFFNHIAEGCACAALGFEHLALGTIGFAANNLLEDEVFSCVIMQFDPAGQTARMVSCGLPALLMVRDGSVERLRGINPPVSTFMEPPVIQEFSLCGVTDILLSTDGLGDAPMLDGGCYRDRLEADLESSVTAAQLFELHKKYCNLEDNDDDITLIRLICSGISEKTAEQHRLSSPGTLGGIAKLEKQILDLLAAAGCCGERLDSLEIALNEALLNAFEHGCLQMGKNKQCLLLSGEYDDLVMSAKPVDGVEINVVTSIVSRKGQLQVWLDITDPGPGFGIQENRTPKLCLNAPSGRGYHVMRRSVDLVRRSHKGNRIILMQMFEKENLWK